MTASMTAYASKEILTPCGVLQWELRSVNHKYFEINQRLADNFRVLEAEVKTIVNKKVKRGKCYCQLSFEPTDCFEQEIQLNHKLVNQLIAVYHHIGDTTNYLDKINLFDLLNWPGVVETTHLDFPSLQQSALDLLHTTLDELVAMRLREGEQLKSVILQRCQLLQQHVDKIKQQHPQMLLTAKQKLMDRLAELSTQVDRNRLEQEILLFSQKLDIEEELDRLTAHVVEVVNILKLNQPVGRRLDFMMQEFNREANTVAAKSCDIAITKLAVEIKVLIEQMREQVQNIE